MWRLFAQATTVFAAAAVVLGVFLQVGGKPPSYRDVVSKILPSVVSIYGRDDSGSETTIGSGVIVSGDGYILTNYHLIANIGRIEVGVKGGDSYIAELVGIDPEIDIAVLRVKAHGLPAIGSAEEGAPEPGDIVFAIGNPFGLNRSTTMGIVSAIGRDRLGLQGFERFIQTDAAINPGSSGGALANIEGNLVGINSALFYRQHGITPQGIGFAIPAELAMHSYDRLISDAPPAGNALGAEVRKLSQRLLSEIMDGRQPAPFVLLITRVWPETPAAGFGLRVGDIVLRVNGGSPKPHVADGGLLPSARQLAILRDREEFALDLQ